MLNSTEKIIILKMNQNGKCNSHEVVNVRFHDAIRNGNHTPHSGPKHARLTLCKAVLIYSKWKQGFDCGIVT